jgi:hypothetical protein
MYSDDEPKAAFAAVDSAGSGFAGYPYLVRPDSSSAPVALTDEPGYYTATSACSPRPGVYMIAYQQHNARVRRIGLAQVAAGERAGHGVDNAFLTGWSRVNRPAAAAHDGSLVVAWEIDRESPGAVDASIAAVVVGELASVEKVRLGLTAGARYYRPRPVSTPVGPVILAERFFNAAYSIVVFSRADDGAYRESIIVSVPGVNCLMPSALVLDDSLLIGFEGSRPLTAGYLWPTPRGNVTIPTFGHGWRVDSRAYRAVVPLHMLGTPSAEQAHTSVRPDRLVRPDDRPLHCPVIVDGGEAGPLVAGLELHDRELGYRTVLCRPHGNDLHAIHESGLTQRDRHEPAIAADGNGALWILGHRRGDSRGGWMEYVTVDGAAGAAPFGGRTEPDARAASAEAGDRATTMRPRAVATGPDQTSIDPRRYEIERDGSRFSVYWADFHMHTNVSVCSLGTDFHCSEIDEKYPFTRDVGGMDIAVITDHDDMSGYDYFRVVDEAEFYDRPGTFLAFPGYEWTSSQSGEHENYGHYCVFATEPPPLLRCDDPSTQTPRQVWDRLEGAAALTLPHHPADGKHPLDWDYFDKVFAPLVEVFQVRGSYECDGCEPAPQSLGRPYIPGLSLQAGLERGYTFGFSGGGEHEGVGVTGVLAPELTRDAVYEALRERRTYATTGIRALVDFRVNGALMGSMLRADGAVRAQALIEAPDTIRLIELKLNGDVVYSREPDAARAELVHDVRLPEDRVRSYLYLVVSFANGEKAWASPVFVSRD